MPDIWHQIEIEPLDGRISEFPKGVSIEAFAEAHVEPQLMDFSCQGFGGDDPGILVTGWSTWQRVYSELAKLCTRRYPVRVTITWEGNDDAPWSEQRVFEGGKEVRHLESQLVDSRLPELLAAARAALNAGVTMSWGRQVGGEITGDGPARPIEDALRALVEVLS